MDGAPSQYLVAGSIGLGQDNFAPWRSWFPWSQSRDQGHPALEQLQAVKELVDWRGEEVELMLAFAVEHEFHRNVNHPLFHLLLDLMAKSCGEYGIAAQ